MQILPNFPGFYLKLALNLFKKNLGIMQYAKLDPYRSAVAFCFETFFGAV